MADIIDNMDNVDDMEPNTCTVTNTTRLALKFPTISCLGFGVRKKHEVLPLAPDSGHEQTLELTGSIESESPAITITTPTATTTTITTK